MKNKNKDDTWAHNTSLMNEDEDYMDIQTDRLLMIYNNIHDRLLIVTNLLKKEED